MNTHDENKQSFEADAKPTTHLPRYEAPRIQELSERDILNSFQLTQSMASWWATM